MKRKFNQLSSMYNAGRQIYDFGKSAYNLVKRRKFATPGGRSKKKKNYGGGAVASFGAFNAGYTIVNRKAVNSKRRKSKGKSRFSRVRKQKKVKKQANIAGKLLRKIQKRIIALNEIETGRGSILLPNLKQSGPDVLNSKDWYPLQLIDISQVDTRQDRDRIYSLHRWNDIAAHDRLLTSKNYQFEFSQGVYRKAQPDGEISTSIYNVSNLRDSTITDGVASDTATEGEVRRWYQHDVNIDLMMYGQSNQDTLYRLDVVMFDPWVCDLIDGLRGNGRDTLFNSDIGAVSPVYQNIGVGVHERGVEWNNLWHGLVAPYTQNPMIRRPATKHMKILKTYQFKIPEQSNQFDRQPCVKTKIKIAMSRVRDRYWRSVTRTANTQVDPENADTLNLRAYDDKTDTDLLSKGFGNGFLNPKQRVFFMIRCTNNDQRVTSNFENIGVDPGNDPTYDINMRTSFTF